MNIKQQLIKQQFPSYQHSEGTCYCPICLCGKCYCKPKPQQTNYVQEPKSTYNRDFDSRRTPIKTTRLPNQQYQGRQKALSLHSVYNDDFEKKEMNKSFLDESQQPKKNLFAIPFCGCNSYSIQYYTKQAAPPQILKPLNQIAMIPAKMNVQSSYQREHQRKVQDGDKIINFSKIMNQRLHTNSKEKNVYLNSSYSEQYKGTTAKRVQRLPVQASYLPFGLSNQGINTFMSTNKQDFDSQKIYQCEANSKLEELCQHIQQ